MLTRGRPGGWRGPGAAERGEHAGAAPFLSRRRARGPVASLRERGQEGRGPGDAPQGPEKGRFEAEAREEKSQWSEDRKFRGGCGPGGHHSRLGGPGDTSPLGAGGGLCQSDQVVGHGLRLGRPRSE